MNKKVFVSGCFDMLHSGHIAFFKAAAEYGDLYVAIGADRTVFELKGRPTSTGRAGPTGFTKNGFAISWRSGQTSTAIC